MGKAASSTRHFTVALADATSQFLTSWQTGDRPCVNNQIAAIRHCQRSEREAFHYPQL